MTKEARQERQASKDSHSLATRSLLPMAVKISRNIPPLLRSCCLTVLEPVTLVSGVTGTFFNSSSGMWVIKGYEIWAIFQPLPSQRRQQILKMLPRARLAATSSLVLLHRDHLLSHHG